MLPSELHQKLYGQAPSDWKPILTFKFQSGAVAWAPGAQRGREPATDGVVATGVWGGCVRNYTVGFNAQPCLLTFVGLDIDGGNHAGANNVDGLAERVARVLPEAYVRSSKSGLGAHVFLILSNPPEYPTKLDAQRAAKAFAAPYVDRLTAAGIAVDKAAVNQLWVVSEGGKQRDVQVGSLIQWVAPAVAPVVAASVPGSGDVVPRSKLGEHCRQIVEALEGAGVITPNPNGVATLHRIHIKAAQDALQTLPWARGYCTVKSAGTRLDQPNATLSLRDGVLSLYSFVGGRAIISLPLFA